MTRKIIYSTVTDGDWIQPRRRGYRMQCCDCGLIHRLNFRLVPYGKDKFHIQFQAFREDDTMPPALAPVDNSSASSTLHPSPPGVVMKAWDMTRRIEAELAREPIRHGALVSLKELRASMTQQDDVEGAEAGP